MTRGGSHRHLQVPTSSTQLRCATPHPGGHGGSGARPSRTDAIREKWIRNLLRNRPDLAAERLRRTRQLTDRAVPDCLVVGLSGGFLRLPFRCALRRRASSARRAPAPAQSPRGVLGDALQLTKVSPASPRGPPTCSTVRPRRPERIGWRRSGPARNHTSDFWKTERPHNRKLLQGLDFRADRDGGIRTGDPLNAKPETIPAAPGK